MKKQSQKRFQIIHTSIVVLIFLSMLTSCATVVHGWNHGFKTPVFIREQNGKVFVEGKEYDVKMVVSGGDVSVKESYSSSITTQTLYFNDAVLVFPKQKYITLEFRAEDNITVRERYLLRRAPNYAYFFLNFFVYAGVGSIVDLSNNLAYDWELVDYQKFN